MLEQVGGGTLDFEKWAVLGGELWILSSSLGELQGGTLGGDLRLQARLGRLQGYPLGGDLKKLGGELWVLRFPAWNAKLMSDTS